MTPVRVSFVLLAAFVLSACVSFPDAPAPQVSPSIEENQFRSVDGAKLGLSAWAAPAPRAVIVALHGMNDYANMYDGPAQFWAEEYGVTTYALDQRGFGRSPMPGRWAGEETMIADLRAVIAAARAKHPGLPVFALGHSMGAGVALSAVGEGRAPAVDGLVLAAPAVAGGALLNP
ncbi:MAG: alpha/beta fold hydrolase, partial [Pseudomonadota bacterium]